MIPDPDEGEAFAEQMNTEQRRLVKLNALSMVANSAHLLGFYFNWNLFG